MSEEMRAERKAPSSSGRPRVIIVHCAGGLNGRVERAVFKWVLEGVRGLGCVIGLGRKDGAIRCVDGIERTKLGWATRWGVGYWAVPHHRGWLRLVEHH